ncbi:response regulator [Ramlibacter sp. AW1]|uniref:histidine kinase n=1 Tax=Ramlibacter aurantiacus TaxID=2801330 RepID=A0A936ZHN0_9BURK|nr:response regulator [Ramlibacter aurantiacus]MBL0420032.1 response regulator [Ramlibacter aurantiacus]
MKDFQSALAPAPRASAASLRALLLEDSRFDAELLREKLLASYPEARLAVVGNERDFRDALQLGGWDVVLSDYEVPGFDGEQALKLARELCPGTPFIFVSGVIGEDNAVEMLKRGATDYVSKGRLSRLPLVVERALREVGERVARGEAQLRLREANDIYARVVDSLRGYAVILLDERGVVRSWNQAACEIFGLSRTQAIGSPLERLFTPEDRQAGVPQMELAQAVRRGKADDNRWLMRSDGLRLWAEGVLIPLHGDQGQHTGFCKIVRDATADYRDAEALRAAKEEAERANKAKDRFLAVLSHELRTPLAPIATAAHLLERVATVPEKYRNLLPMIQRNIALESRLIEDLLDLTAISAGKLHLKFETVDMHRVAQTVADMLDAQIQEKHLRLELHLQASHSLIDADEARMQQVVWNLVRNAVKFTPEGGRIELRTASEDDIFVLHCVDSGIGIDTEALPRIFGAFEQADQEVSGRFGGLGLGLAIARGLVLEHGGRIQASSAGRGQGATFTLRLPLHQARTGTDEATGTGALPAPDTQGKRVLLVEDNLDAAETIAMCLESFGWRVTHVATCAAALEAANGDSFDVVLTDLGLPDGSGIDVGRALSPRLPVVALSGYGASPDLRRSAMAGFSGHLVKPAQPDDVHAALQKALRNREAAGSDAG